MTPHVGTFKQWKLPNHLNKCSATPSIPSLAGVADGEVERPEEEGLCDGLAALLALGPVGLGDGRRQRDEVALRPVLRSAPLVLLDEEPGLGVHQPLLFRRALSIVFAVPDKHGPNRGCSPLVNREFLFGDN